jgi:hypothetical protein
MTKRNLAILVVVPAGLALAAAPACADSGLATLSGYPGLWLWAAAVGVVVVETLILRLVVRIAVWRLLPAAIVANAFTWWIGSARVIPSVSGVGTNRLGPDLPDLVGVLMFCVLLGLLNGALEFPADWALVALLARDLPATDPPRYLTPNLLVGVALANMVSVPLVQCVPLVAPPEFMVNTSGVGKTHLSAINGRLNTYEEENHHHLPPAHNLAELRGYLGWLPSSDFQCPCAPRGRWFPLPYPQPYGCADFSALPAGGAFKEPVSLIWDPAAHEDGKAWALFSDGQVREVAQSPPTK